MTAARRRCNALRRWPFNIERELFLRGEVRSVVAPGSGRRIDDDPLRRTEVGIPRLGPSEGVAVGAYAFPPRHRMRGRHRRESALWQDSFSEGTMRRARRSSDALDTLIARIVGDAKGDSEHLRAFRQAFEDEIAAPANALVMGEPASP